MKGLWITCLGLVLLFSLSCSKSTKPIIQSGWELLYVGEDVDLLSVSFVDEDYGWVGARSHWEFIVFHTTDGGNTWVKQKLPYSNWASLIGKVFFIDRYNGWVVGSTGIIAHTTDGGKSWSLQERVVDHSLYELQFVDINYGWIGAGGWAFLRTTDGGENWSFSSGVSGFDFLDSLNGFGGNRDYILRTSDGGVTWQEVAERPLYRGGFDFVDLQKGWGIDEFRQAFFDTFFCRIVHTTDGGKTWIYQTELFRGAQIRHLIMIDEYHGWAGKGTHQGPAILHTSDGETWKEQLLPSFIGSIHDIFFLDRNNGWAIGAHGLVLRTKNGGNPITK
ncbi:MAG: YCF48-related protein [Candidatus Zixiibacteriota bacterium]